MRLLCWTANVLYAIADRLGWLWLTNLSCHVLEQHDRWYRDEPPAIVWRIMR
jgi:hypothetical protein